MQFEAVIELRGINPYILVPADRCHRLQPGWRRAMPVRVQLNGQPDPPWRINMMPVGDGSFYLYLDARVRRAAGVDVGNSVTVSLDFDPITAGGPRTRCCLPSPRS